MSEPETLSRSQRKRRRKAEKRKASQSPESINSAGQLPGQAILNSSRSPSGTQVNTFDSLSALNNSADYVSAVMNPNTQPVLNFAQHVPFSFQAQTPNVFQSPVQTQQTSPLQSSATPAWAARLIQSVEQLQSVIPKIDKIEETVSKIQSKISLIETRVTGLETKITDIETTCTFISSEYDYQKNELQQAKEKIKILEKDCRNLEQSLKTCENHYEKSKDELTDLKSRSMRENLVFYGLKEENEENCEILVKELIQTELGIDPSSMEIDRAHRLGSTSARKPRPIVVKFHRYLDREMIRIKTIEEETRSKLKDKRLGVGIQTPPELREARKALYPASKQEQDRGNRTRIVGNKLYVNNVLKKKFVDGNIIDCSL